MTVTVAGLLTAALLLTIAIGFTATLLAWRERPEPGAAPLVAMLAGQVVWSTCLVFELQASTLGAKLFWEELTWLGIVVIPVAWLLFALEYTGRDQYVRARTVGALAVVPAITAALALTSQSHSLLYAESTLVEFQGQAFLHREPGPWLWVITGYTYLLGLLGSLPLIGLVQSKTSTFRGQSGALLVGTLAPWASNVLFLVGAIPIPALDPTPIAFSISGIAYLGAVTQFRLFGTNPAANQHARRQLIDQLQQGAVVVDSHGYVVDVNASAERIFGLDPARDLGKPARELIPDYDRLTDEANGSDHRTIHSEETGRLYDVTQTDIVDTHDRIVGTIVTFHDISDHVRHQQRHEVLNRVFRHNIRTETNLIVSHADLLDPEATVGDPASVKRSALRIQEVADKARTIVDLFEERREPTTPAQLAALLDRCVGRVDTDYPAATFDVDDVAADVFVADVLETVLDNVLENAVAHNDSPTPHVTITVDDDGDAVEIAVADDGPGIDPYERAVIERGTETALEHGSGLGLWLITWGAEIVGGDVSFADNEPSGTVVELTVPTLPPPTRTHGGDGGSPVWNQDEV